VGDASDAVAVGQRAIEIHGEEQAPDLARQIGSPWDEAHALAGLGRCAMAAGRTAEAEDNLRQALEIFQRTGAVEAAGVSAELEALTSARPSA
jgi:Flp pilus assembly protein TadD